VKDPSEIHITKNPIEQTPYQLLTYVTPIDASNNPHDPSEKQQKSTVTYGIPLVMLTVKSCLFYADDPEKGDMAPLEPEDRVQFITIETDPSAKMEEINFVLSNFTCGSKNGSFQKNMDSSSLFNSYSNVALRAKIEELSSSLLSLAQTLYGQHVVTEIPFSFDGVH
jgi:hypothetical protein